MKMYWLAPLALGLLAVGARAEDAAPAADSKAKTSPAPAADNKAKTSYAVGVDLGRNLHGVGAEVDVEQMVRGLRDGLTGAKPAMSDAEIKQLITTYRTELAQKQHELLQHAMADNKEQGEKFQADYKKKSGVIVLADGLMYRVLKAGNGKKPTDADTVSCNYAGRLVSGAQFDANEPGKPATFKLNAGLIQGWKEAVLQMPVGSKWEVVIPPGLGYGDRGAGRDIPPGSTLVFDIELVSIADAPAPKSDAK
jgi:FKBP-type peptidyl-prolyl cis-trans isomerase